MLCQRPELSHNAVALASAPILGSTGNVGVQVHSPDIESRFRINTTDVLASIQIQLLARRDG